MGSYVAHSISETDFFTKTNSRGNARQGVAFSTLRAALQGEALKTPVNAVAASGVVTFSGTPVADETLTIGTAVFTFKATRSAPFQITINANNTTQGDNLVTAIAADLTNVTAVNSTGTVTITAAVKGAAGNLIALSESATGTAVSSVTNGKLDGGIDGTVGAAGETCVDSTYLYAAIAENTVSGANWRRISLGSVY
jgi:phage tail sheath gpL-like